MTEQTISKLQYVKVYNARRHYGSIVTAKTWHQRSHLINKHCLTLVTKLVSWPCVILVMALRS